MQPLLRIVRPLLCGYLALHALSAPAEDIIRYAVEQTEFAIRSGKNYKNESLASIKNLEAVTVLEDDSASGWSRVKTAAGIEGWIQSKYLMDSPRSSRCPAQVNSEIGKLKAENQKLHTEVAALRAAPTAAPQVATPTAVPCPAPATPAAEPAAALQSKTESELAQARAELAQLKDAQPADLRSVQRNWFLGGALATFLGALVGRLLARTAWARE